MSAGRGAEHDGEFFVLLAGLRSLKSGPLAGQPSDRALARAAGVSPTTVGSWLRGTQFPHEVGKVLAVVRMLAGRAATLDAGVLTDEVAALLDEERWRKAFRQEADRRAQVVSAGVRRAQAVMALSGPSAGRLLAEVTDPFTLEVHRPAEPGTSHAGLPLLPDYVLRAHDAELRRVVTAAADGASRVAVLVGSSSTGKTRACWEALQLLRDHPGAWRVWHPIHPSRPTAALRELPSVGRRTVVWLNDAQLYLGAAGSRLGEQVAAGLRELLRDPARTPVLVLATLWTQSWDVLMAPAAALPAVDPHEQARKLLDGHAIHVPAAFTPGQMRQLRHAGDPRLAQAAVAAQDGQVTQFLAGVPELMARYRNAPPAAAALIHVAMDARRLGMGIALPSAFLGAAAPGYLTDAEWDALDEDWLEQAIAYTAVPCKGVRGPLTRIRPRPTRSRPPRPGSRSPHRHLPTNESAGVVSYRLADYLDQLGQGRRGGQLPPASFWAAAADHASPADQAALGRSAHARGLYRDAAQLYKNAAAGGNTDAALYLAGTQHIMSDDDRPARWAAMHVPADDPYAVAQLLGVLREIGADELTRLLLTRNPARHAALTAAADVDDLLRRLIEVHAGEQIAALAARVAAEVSLSDPASVSRLLRRMQAAQADEQVATLAKRAVRIPLGDPARIAVLLRRLQKVGAGRQAMMLARRAAADAPLHEPYATGRLLAGLRAIGADEQVRLLATRATAQVPLDDPAAVDWLLGSCLQADAADEVTGLIQRNPAAHVPIDDPYAIGNLLERLAEAGAVEQVQELASRAAARIPLDKPAPVIGLLFSLRAVAAEDQAELLAARAAAQIPLDKPTLVTRMLDSLRDMNLEDQRRVLENRYSQQRPYPAADPSGGPPPVADNQATRSSTLLRDGRALGGDARYWRARFPFGREADGSPAEPWGWQDLD